MTPVGYHSGMDKTNIYLDETDKQAIAHIKEQYGVATASAAIRLAIRQVAGMQSLEEQRANHPWRKNQDGGLGVDAKTLRLYKMGGLKAVDVEIDRLDAEQREKSQCGNKSGATMTWRRLLKVREDRKRLAEAEAKGQAKAD